MPSTYSRSLGHQTLTRKPTRFSPCSFVSYSWYNSQLIGNLARRQWNSGTC